MPQQIIKDRLAGALTTTASWPGADPRATRGPGRGGPLPAPALLAASSLALAGREPGRLCNPGLPGHRQLKEETLRGPGTAARSAEKDFKTRTARERRS